MTEQADDKGKYAKEDSDTQASGGPLAIYPDLLTVLRVGSTGSRDDAAKL